MGAEEDSLRRKKDFQKSSDDDLEAFISKKDTYRSTQAIAPPKTEEPEASKITTQKSPPAEQSAAEDHEEQIRAARASRAMAEAHHDVALLRKKAHAESHAAARMFHKYRLNEAKAQKCSSRAVAYREKAESRREKATLYRDSVKELESELSGAATGNVDLSPEAIRNKIASTERKAAKQDEIARKYEKKAAVQTEKAAKYRTRALKYLEKNKEHENEAKMYTKRADNLEKAGTDLVKI